MSSVKDFPTQDGQTEGQMDNGQKERLTMKCQLAGNNMTDDIAQCSSQRSKMHLV